MAKKSKSGVKPPYTGPIPNLTPFTEKPLPGEWEENYNSGKISERLARSMRRQLEREGWYQPAPRNFKRER